jgi:hypothetical protein
MEWNELSLEPSHLGVPSGVSKTLSEPMVHLAQTVHLSFSDTNTVSDWTEMGFHMSHVTLEFYQASKTISNPMLSQCKSHTYLASRLALSPNEPKRAST